MLKRLAIAVAILSATLAAPWIWFKPDPLFAPVEHQRAQLLSSYTWRGTGDWFGGFSGLELSADGNSFVAITDKGHIVAGTLERENDLLRNLAVTEFAHLLDVEGEPVVHPRTDAEGLAIADDGLINISFEGVARVWNYASFDQPAQWSSYRMGWRALGTNGGLEALAIDGTGMLWTVAEVTGKKAKSTLVYTRRPNEKWKQTYVLPVSERFRPVGADFGPDGKLYLLERDLYPFGFRSRVRVLTLSEEGIRSQETVLETPLGRHDNLEGIAVWVDTQARTRLTLVSDNNFLPVQKTEIVEFWLR